jgi:hypothetical protein
MVMCWQPTITAVSTWRADDQRPATDPRSQVIAMAGWGQHQT